MNKQIIQINRSHEDELKTMLRSVTQKIESFASILNIDSHGAQQQQQYRYIISCAAYIVIMNDYTHRSSQDLLEYNHVQSKIASAGANNKRHLEYLAQEIYQEYLAKSRLSATTA
jgi:hypothetical protein